MSATLILATLTGTRYTIDFDTTKTVEEFKKAISKKINIIPERQKIIFCGKILENEKSVDTYNVQEQTILHLLIIDEKEYWEEIMQKKDVQLRETIISNQTPKIIEHKMKVHLRHTQDWSYGIRYNILQNTLHTSEGSGSPGVIDGLFPKEKIPYIKKISIINIKNTLTMRHGLSRRPGNIISGGNSRSANLDLNGNLWTETPYGHRYGACVTWDSYIDIVILYEDK